MKLIQKETRNIDMTMNSTTRKLEVYNLEILNLSGKFPLNSEVYKVERNTLLSLPNPKYNGIIEQHRHLPEINMNECDTKPDLPIHMFLRASVYAWIKARVIPRVGPPEELVAELTQFGWVIEMTMR